MKVSKTQNIHPDIDQVYLGYVSAQPIPNQQLNFQTSYVGYLPTWITVPNSQSLKCQLCIQKPQNNKKSKQSHKKQMKKSSEQSSSQADQQQKEKQAKSNNILNQKRLMTFVGQVFCALQADHTYNRVIYIFYCQNCRKNYKAIRQQSKKDFQLTQQQNKQILQINKMIIKLSQQAYQLQTDSLPKKQVTKIVSKAKFDAEQQAIQEAQEDQSEQEDDSFKSYQKDSKLSKEELKELQQAETEEIPQNPVKKTQKNMMQIHPSLNTPKDINFQIYRRVMTNLKFPTLIYCFQPIAYNLQALNPRHKCQHCSSQLKLQIQITEQLLSSISKNIKLAAMDWGSLFIYTCTSSCEINSKENVQQQIIVQYESDAIKDQQIRKLNKKRKNRKKQKARKSKSRSRGKQQSHNTEPFLQIKQNKSQQADWD